jgi:hypothetical protein
MVCLGLVACTDGGSEPSGMKVVEGRAPAVSVSARAPTINALEPYERLVRNFERCALEGNQIVSTCPAVAQFETEMQGVSPEIEIKVGESMIGSASPAVRVQAATMMLARGKLSAKSIDAITRVAASERDPRVLEAFIRIVGSEQRAAPLLLTAADHPDVGVRLDAVEALAHNPAGAEKLVMMAEHDADQRVRRSACEQAGRLGLDAVLPLYERTTASAADPDFYAACMEGLAAMFHNHPSFNTTSEAAYRLFLRRLEAVPRSEASPPWTVMSVFCYDSRETNPGALAAWRQRATWFDAAEVRRVLASVISDRSASMAARSAAIESLVGLDAPPVEVAALRKELVQPADKPLSDKLAAICE